MKKSSDEKRRNFWWSDIHAWLVVGTLVGLFSGLLGLSGYGLLIDAAHAEESSRKLKSGAPPEYPELARRLHIKGVARVQARVSPEGSVKEVKELGGNPVLLEALVQAVKSWKYTSAPGESTVEIKFDFTP